MNKIKRIALTTVLVLGISMGAATTAQADTRPVPSRSPISSHYVRGSYGVCKTFGSTNHRVCWKRHSAPRRVPIDYSRWTKGTGPIVVGIFKR